MASWGFSIASIASLATDTLARIVRLARSNAIGQTTLVRAAGSFLRALCVIAVLGGLPGSGLRPRDDGEQRRRHGDAALAAKSDVKNRDGVALVTVRDGLDGAPLRGARVQALTILDGFAHPADARETDANGRARLDELPEGETWILANAPGKARGCTHLVLGYEPRDVAIGLGPEHWIQVRANDDLGTPLAEVAIEVAAPADPMPIVARTGAEGAVRVGGLDAGPWRVTGRAEGYEDADGRAERDGETVRLIFRKLGILIVHVDSGDLPASSTAGARVEVAGATLWPARATGIDSQSDARIEALPAGVYALRATRGDRVSPIELGVALSRGEEKHVTLHLAPGRYVSTYVTDGDGEDAEPIPRARVTLAEGGLSPFPFEATADAKGRAQLGPISPGSATLGVRADGFVPRGAIPVAQRETHVALVRAGILSGRVVDARGYPVEGATVQIVGTDPSGGPIFDDPRRVTFQTAHFDAMLSGPAQLAPAGELGVTAGPVPAIPHNYFGSGLAALLLSGTQPAVRTGPYEPWVTRADGTFRASPASPGRIRALVRHAHYVEAQSDLVTLAPGGEANVEIVVHQGGTLEGRVLDAADRPVAAARVAVSAERGSLDRSTKTATDGSFAFASVPDAISVTVSAGDDEQPDARIVVAVPEGDRKDIVIHLQPPRGPLAVAVVDDRGRGIDAAQVTATSLSVESPLRTTAFTDSRGSALVKRAAGLALRVEVTAPGRAPRIATTDGTADSLRVELGPAERATGEVLDARVGTAIAGAEVTFYSDLGVRRTRTDAKGAFSLTDVAPGAGRLRVGAEGFALQFVSVTLPESGGRRPYTLPRVELTEEGVVEGDVVDGRGVPIAGARVAKDHVPTWLVLGANPEGIAVTDTKGRFVLRQLAEGTVTVEAFMPDIGRSHVDGVRVVAGRSTPDVRVVLETGSGERDSAAVHEHEPAVSGSVAVTLGESGTPAEVVVVSVAEASEAERAGLLAGDVIVAVDDVPVQTLDEARTRLDGPIANDLVLRIRRGDERLSLRILREAVRR